MSEESMSAIMRKYYELRQYLSFEMINLDKAFMETPTIFEEAGVLVAKADREENIAKHTYDIIKAEAGERIRSTPVGGGKEPSEARIAALLPLEEDVQDARNTLDQARYEAQVCTALYKSLESQTRLISKSADMINSGFIAPSGAYEQRVAELRQARIKADTGKERTPIGRPTA